jgi:site-specific DNA-methyltransferase (adenine-specific)
LTELLNKVTQGDCLEVMRQIPDKSVDMILCDLPYGTTACKWDAIIPFEKLWKEYERLIKDNGAIVLTASQPFTSALVMSNPKGFKHSWVWHKKSAGNILTAKYAPLKTTEDVLVFSRKGERVNYYPIFSRGHEDRTKDGKDGVVGKKRSDLFNTIKSGTFKHGNNKPADARYPKHLIEFSNASRVGVVHPTQKPVPLFEYLIRTYTQEGDIVLDNCIGSGTTAVAAINTDRQFIGIEREHDYVEIANKRIAEAKEGVS